MKVDDRCDNESLLALARVEMKSTFRLADQIHGIICDIPVKNAIVSLAGTMANIILSIECPVCRRLYAELALREAGTALQQAIAEAANNGSPCATLAIDRTSDVSGATSPRTEKAA